jgi:glycosyltransferase involved in cell wall biosynthesis
MPQVPANVSVNVSDKASAKVSICIPTYNRSHYLAYAIASVLAQTYSNFELIVCDDGSQDNTPDLIASLSDDRLRYLRHPQNIGRSRNMRSGFEAATGEYFIKFDDDDALTPDFLAKTVAILESYPTVDLVCTNHWIINKNSDRMETATQANSTKWGKDKLPAGIIPDLLWQTYYYQSLQVGSTLFRYEALKTIDFMRPEADGCEDFDLLVRFALADKQGYFLPEYLMEYRFHQGQSSLKQNIHFLSAKLFCVASYQFCDQKLEKERHKNLALLQQTLGLRLLEAGETIQGRSLLQQSTQVLGTSRRYRLGIILSYLPLAFRQFVLEKFRNLRPKDYTEVVRSEG